MNTTTKEELTAHVDVADDSGRVETIYFYTTLVGFRPINGPMTWAPGSKRIATASGGPVNLNADGSFTEVLSDRRLRRVSP